MNEPRISPLAETYLEEIWAYFAQAGEATANRFIEKLLNQCRQLAKLPRMGRAREDLALNLRSFPVQKYVIFYRPVDDTVEIVRVLYGARDFGAVFLDPTTDD